MGVRLGVPLPDLVDWCSMAANSVALSLVPLTRKNKVTVHNCMCKLWKVLIYLNADEDRIARHSY